MIAQPEATSDLNRRITAKDSESPLFTRGKNSMLGVCDPKLGEGEESKNSIGDSVVKDLWYGEKIPTMQAKFVEEISTLENLKGSHPEILLDALYRMDRDRLDQRPEMQDSLQRIMQMWKEQLTEQPVKEFPKSFIKLLEWTEGFLETNLKERNAHLDELLYEWTDLATTSSGSTPNVWYKHPAEGPDRKDTEWRKERATREKAELMALPLQEQVERAYLYSKKVPCHDLITDLMTYQDVLTDIRIYKKLEMVRAKAAEEAAEDKKKQEANKKTGPSPFKEMVDFLDGQLN
eukprot:Filipodium_phascolosomae@DN4554_c0_g1_i1.p1